METWRIAGPDVKQSAVDEHRRMFQLGVINLALLLSSPIYFQSAAIAGGASSIALPSPMLKRCMSL